MSIDRLDFDDRTALRAWLDGLENAARDLSAVAFDATESPARRELGRALAARLVSESMSALDGLIMHARRGLDDGPEPSDPAGNPGH